MKILKFTLAVFGGNKKGGGERYVSETAKALVEIGARVSVVVVPSYKNLSLQPDPGSEPGKLTLRGLVAQVQSADVLHVHQLNSPGFDYALMASKAFSKPIVLTDHGGGALALGRSLGASRLRMVTAAGFVSNWSRRDVDPKGLIKRYEILFGGGDHLPIAPSLPERFDFGFIGRLLPHKGAHVAIEALPLGARLVIAGQVRDRAYFHHLQKLSQGKAVTFVEDASDDFVARLTRSIRYLLVPSVSQYGEAHYTRPELLGIVALEALASGTPVIGSDVGGLGELLRVAKQQPVPAGNVGAWKASLTRAFEGSDSQVSSAEFKWSAVAERCMRLYDVSLKDKNYDYGR